MTLKPAAFMSYCHVDDQYERLTEFRERLSEEVRIQTGEEFPIFQDRNIQWGEDWRERIEESLDATTFLIAIITPSFFNSSECRGELEQFLEREKELKRNDLILPLYYVSCPLLDDEAKRTTDKLAQVIASRQYADWRELRFQPFTTPQIGKTFAQLAIQIRDALERGPSPPKAAPKSTAHKTRARAAAEPSAPAAQGSDSATETAEATRGPSAKTEPPTRVVDAMRRGDHSTITEAIEAADPGDRILVRPGLYEEGLVIDKPLEIIGQGDPGEVVVQATGKDTLMFRTTMGRVVNLTLQQMGDGDWYGVDIGQGRLELEGCDITSRSLACVAIHGGADPRLRRNRIHDGNQGGVMVYENGQGTLEDNDIFANTLAGVEIRDASNPTLRRNRIHDGKESGVYVHDNGHGTLEDNDIFANAFAGVAIERGSNPLLRGNRINGNKRQAVCVREAGGGTIEDNDLRDNARGAWAISEDSEPNVKRARNQE